MSSPNADKTRTREEKRREEKNKQPIYTPGNDVRIPQNVNSEAITAAIGRWITHINNDDTHKSIYPNSPQEEATWRLVASWRESEESTVAAIDAAIAGQWSNLRKPEPPKQSRSNGKPQGGSILDFIPDDEPEGQYSEQF